MTSIGGEANAFLKTRFDIIKCKKHPRKDRVYSDLNVEIKSKKDNKISKKVSTY